MQGAKSERKRAVKVGPSAKTTQNEEKWKERRKKEGRKKGKEMRKCKGNERKAIFHIKYAIFQFPDLQTHLFEIVNNIDLSRGIRSSVAITCDVKGFCCLFGVNFNSFV